MGKSSSRKGAAFERRVAKMFSEALDVQLLRTPLSGGWGYAETKGDLVPGRGDTVFPFFVECKNTQDWDLWSTVFSSVGPVFMWWTKAVAQAHGERKTPILVLGHDQKPPIAVVYGSDVTATPNKLANIQHIYIPPALLVLKLKDLLNLMSESEFKALHPFS